MFIKVSLFSETSPALKNSWLRAYYGPLYSSLRPATLFKKGTLAQVFSCAFCEISKNNFFTEHFWAAASASPNFHQ